MKARLADSPAPKAAPAPKHTPGDVAHASAVLAVILDTPDLLNRLLEHPAVTARMEKILEDYEFEVDVKADVDAAITPRLKTITDITTRLNVRLTAVEAGKPKPPLPSKSAPGELALG